MILPMQALTCATTPPTVGVIIGIKQVKWMSAKAMSFTGIGIVSTSTPAPNVLLWGNSLKMQGVYARRRAAQVVQVQAVGDLTVPELVGYPVSAFRSTGSDLKEAVILCVAGALPDPAEARVSCGHFTPEASSDRIGVHQEPSFLDVVRLKVPALQPLLSYHG